MSPPSLLAAFGALAMFGSCLFAQGTIRDVEWSPFRAHCRDLVKKLEDLKAPLPPATVKAINDVLAKEARDPDGACAAVQRLLDAHCLVTVHINPQSRVKA